VAKQEEVTLKKLILIISGLAFVLVTALAGCNSTTITNTRSTATQQPIDVVSVSGPLQPINPGGPVVEITLKNVGAEPVVTLNANLETSRTFTFNFAISSSNPLLPGETISAKLTLIGGGFSTSLSYPLTINGTEQNGDTFSYTKQVYIVQPSNK